MPGANRNTLAVPATPWGLAWLLHNTDAQGLTDLGFSAAMQALIGSLSVNHLRPALQLGVVNVRDAPFLATGDGVTDDTAAFNAAMAVVCPVTGSHLVVYVPPGAYYLPNGISIPVNVHLMGAGTGPGASILQTNNTTLPTGLININATDNPVGNVRISGLQIRLNPAVASTTVGIRVYRTQNVSIDNCFLGAFNRALLLDGAGEVYARALCVESILGTNPVGYVLKDGARRCMLSDCEFVGVATAVDKLAMLIGDIGDTLQTIGNSISGFHASRSGGGGLHIKGAVFNLLTNIHLYDVCYPDDTCPAIWLTENAEGNLFSNVSLETQTVGYRPTYGILIDAGCNRNSFVSIHVPISQLAMIGDNGAATTIVGAEKTVPNKLHHGLELHNGVMQLRDGHVAHGMTGYEPTDVYGSLAATDPADMGGLTIRGLTDGDTPPTLVAGYSGAAAPINPMILLIGAKKNGTGVQAIGAGGILFQIQNYTGERFRVMGNGDTVVQGTLTVNGDQTGAVDHVFDESDDFALLADWRAGRPLPFATGDLLNRDRLLRDAIVQLVERVTRLEAAGGRPGPG